MPATLVSADLTAAIQARLAARPIRASAAGRVESRPFGLKMAAGV
jgi:hypothetical protein